MVATAVAIDDRPSALRYPRGEGLGVPMPDEGKALEIGKGRIIQEGHKVALLSFGARLGETLKAAKELTALGLSATVADARFAKPLDVELVTRLAREHEVLVTIEEGAVGGFGAYVLQSLAEQGLLDQGLRIRCMMPTGSFHRSRYAGGDVCGCWPRRQSYCRQGIRGPGQGCRRGNRQTRLTASKPPFPGYFLSLAARLGEANGYRLLATRDLPAAASASK